MAVFCHRVAWQAGLLAVPLTDVCPVRQSRGLCLQRLLPVDQEHYVPPATSFESVFLGPDAAGLGFLPSPLEFILQHYSGMTWLPPFQDPA